MLANALESIQHVFAYDFEKFTSPRRYGGGTGSPPFCEDVGVAIEAEFGNVEMIMQSPRSVVTEAIVVLPFSLKCNDEFEVFGKMEKTNTT